MAKVTPTEQVSAEELLDSYVNLRTEIVEDWDTVDAERDKRFDTLRAELLSRMKEGEELRAELAQQQQISFHMDGAVADSRSRAESAEKLLGSMREALADANSLCRSAHSIAERKGLQTNWEAFLNQLKQSLARQHKVMYPESVLSAANETKPQSFKRRERGR